MITTTEVSEVRGEPPAQFIRRVSQEPKVGPSGESLEEKVANSSQVVLCALRFDGRL